MNPDLNWLNDIKLKLQTFLEEMSVKDFSYVRYSWSGDIPDQRTKWGVGNLVFTVKILYIARLIDGLQETQRRNLTNNILRFSDKQGYIYDPYITPLSVKQRFLTFIGQYANSLHHQIENIRRAETRQAFAALSLLEQKPFQPFSHIPYCPDAIETYLASFDWNHPWGAGSHFSHLLFFLHFNSVLFDYHSAESHALIRDAITWIMQRQSKDDGCWYIGDDVSLAEKINGAMKVLTGLHAAQIYDFPYPEKLIDTALTGINDKHACDNFNIVYVLYAAHKICPTYRQYEIEQFLLNRLHLYKEYYYPEIGGFSFMKNKANEVYYGKRLSLGKDEPDIHGTVMFIWGLAIINAMMPLGLDFGIPAN